MQAFSFDVLPIRPNRSIYGIIGEGSVRYFVYMPHIMLSVKLMNVEKERAIMIHFLYWIMVFGLLYLLLRYVLYEILPLFIGFLIAFSLRPAIRRTSKLLPFPQKLISFFYLLLFYGTIGTAVTALCIYCFHFLSAFIIQFPALYETNIAPMLDHCFHTLESELANFPLTAQIDMNEFFIQAMDSLHEFTISSSASLFSLFKAITASLPGIIVSFFMTLLSSIFFTMDFSVLSHFIMRQIPKESHDKFYRFRTIVTDTIAHYISAYGRLMIITFAELAIGLMILKVEYAVPIAFLISFFDIFPILGTGTVLYPWIIIAFFQHQMKLASGLLILHLIINIIRQVIEPRIVGKRLGIHPVLMLACMFLGVKCLGFLGIFIAPILLQILVQLNKEGFIRLYR